MGTNPGSTSTDEPWLDEYGGRPASAVVAQRPSVDSEPGRQNERGPQGMDVGRVVEAFDSVHDQWPRYEQADCHSFAQALIPSSRDMRTTTTTISSRRDSTRRNALKVDAQGCCEGATLPR